jgi:hypothetical protein
MKKLLAVSLLSIVFAACSDDDKPGLDTGKLTRKWYPHYIIKGTQTYPYGDEEDITCGNSYIEFKEDNTAVYYRIYECTGSTPEAWEDTGTYSVNGKELVVDFFLDGIEPVVVDELTSTTLKFSYDVVEGDGQTVLYSEIYKSTPQ